MARLFLESIPVHLPREAPPPRLANRAAMPAPLVVQLPDGLEFWPPDEIALLRHDHFGRLAVLHQDGTLAHRPGPLPDTGPWAQVGPTQRVHPRHAGTEIGGWQLPDPTAPAPPTPPAGPDQDVLYVTKHEQGVLWHTTDGGTDWQARSLEQVEHDHPWLARAGWALVNPDHLRRIQGDGFKFRLTLSNGHVLTVSRSASQPLADRLGLPHLNHLEYSDPRARILDRDGIQDFPVELLTADAAYLQRHFRDDPRRLIKCVVWQARHLHARGYGTEHRGFWYRPLLPVLQRAQLPQDNLQYLNCLEEMVGRDRLLTFAELRFEDPRPELRIVGDERPWMLLVAEKTSLRRDWAEACRRFGCSGILLGGQPSLLETEFLAEALRPHLDRPLLQVNLVDYDPSGWILAAAQTDQLERYRIQTREAVHLVSPGRFEAWELELFAYDLNQEDTRVQNWLERTGGIAGHARGIHADHLRPGRRILDAVAELTGFQPDTEGPPPERPRLQALALPGPPTDTPAARAGMLELHDSRGIQFWPRHRIRQLRDEVPGRVEALLDTGDVLHRPGQVAELTGPPFIQTGPGVLVNAGSPADPKDPEIHPGLRASQVLYLEADKPHSVWVADDGRRVRDRHNTTLASRRHPHLVQMGYVYVNVMRLRAIDCSQGGDRAVLDDGTVVRYSRPTRKQVARQLGLPHLRHLEPLPPPHGALLKEGLRDWPEDPLRLPPDGLRAACGHDPRRLLANAIWWCFRELEGGRDPGHGRTHRSFWYRPAKVLLERTGLAGDPDRDYDLLCRLPAQFVGDYRLFTYRDLQFEDSRPEWRGVGDRHPHVLLLGEKEAFLPLLRRAWRELGVSYYVSGGGSTLIGAEFLARDLRHVPAIHVLALTDFDPGGHLVADGVGEHLEFYGRTVASTTFLCTPERFTPEELDLYSYPLPTTSKKVRTDNARWVDRTGGIRGEARGIRADHLGADQVLELVARNCPSRDGVPG